jgi:hypothetical protein
MMIDCLETLLARNNVGVFLLYASSLQLEATESVGAGVLDIEQHGTRRWFLSSAEVLEDAIG